MNNKLTFSVVMSAVAIGMTAAALAQTPAPTAGQTPSASSTQQEETTITGCVVREADFRAARDAGKGGAAGTGVGAGNEFVLTNASASTSAAAGTAGTSGTTGAAYELTGAGEGQLSAHVGKRVEIRGKLKAAETTAAGRPTGGATAGPPPSGVDATSKDLKLREFEVLSVKEASGTCPAK
jgi:hypothetical protein